MAQHICPYLATVDQNYHQVPPVDYPSFENRCMAGGEKDTLLFPQQATFCLSNGHRMCPLFKATRQSASERKSTRGLDWQPVKTEGERGRKGEREKGKVEGGARKAEFPIPNLQSPISESLLLDPELNEIGAVAEDEWLAGRRRWGWIGAGTVFVMVILLGGLSAAWAGWNFANAQLQTRPGEVSIVQPPLANPTIAQSAPFVIWTATSVAENLPAVQAPTQQQNQPSTNQQLSFPAAVTATPAPNSTSLENIGQENSEPTPIVIQPPAQEPIAVPPNGQVLPDIEVEIPTRRATPTIDIAIDQTQVALVDLTLTPSQTPTPLGTPVVIFGPDAKILKADECTKVRWSVQNVKEVYYDNLGVDGKGEREECVHTKDGIFTLRVILPNGATEIYTTTITLELPTPTATPTWTFTPEPILTPTWTPVPPTPIPTPNIRRSVALSIQNGGSHSCVSNSGCTVGLLVANTGEAIDNLTVSKVAGDAWRPLLCRADSVCGNQVPIVSVGPGNTVFLEIRLSIPADASSGQKQTYQFSATSDGSGGTVTSETVALAIVVE